MAINLASSAIVDMEIGTSKEVRIPFPMMTGFIITFIGTVTGAVLTYRGISEIVMYPI